MKTKALIFGLSTAALVSPAMADKTFYMTGATAFRQATLDTIDALYGGTYDSAVVGNDKEFTFVGELSPFPGETTTILCSFRGSVQGLKAISSNVLAEQPTFIPGSAVTIGGGKDQAGVATVQAFADYSFSDVSITSSPFGATPVYPSADSPAGVVVFSMVTNDGSPITNVTSQSFRALFTRGYQDLKLFTGVASDISQVVASGRNDGSGTRTTYLAETGHGITNLVNQYYVASSSGDFNTAWNLTEAGSSYKSDVWGQDFDGNGGYSSGGDLRAVLARKSDAACTINISGFPIYTGKVDTVSWLSLSDSIKARDTGGAGTGAQLCAYNGVGLDDVAADLTAPVELSTADIEKITEGAYTAWGNQQFYGRDGLNADQITFFDAIMAGVDSQLTAGALTGVPLSAMNVDRGEDGGVVGP